MRGDKDRWTRERVAQLLELWVRGATADAIARQLGVSRSAVMGKVADMTSINLVYHVCSFLPAIGILAVFLPNLEPRKRVVA